MEGADIAIYWRICRRTSFDFYVGYNRLTCALSSRWWPLSPLERPPAPIELLDNASASIAYSGGGWSQSFAREALPLRPMVESGELTKQTVVFRPPFAAEGWTVASKQVARAKLGLWKLLSAIDDDSAQSEADRLASLS
ncbi:MAG: hypothetical protein HN348_32260 [Proteobacteria bacterium]|nr:hypothetical protein [Pseudomonadota bacterium]